LADYLGLEQAEAAHSMGISRSTFTRLIERARRKLVEFVVSGIPLTIEGGNIHFKNNVIICRACNYVEKTEIDQDIIRCPQCSSTDLLKLAEVFGHGNCCEEYRNN
jgi:Zn finger protein HypA/HybF involved in hydrogenase expression